MINIVAVLLDYLVRMTESIRKLFSFELYNYPLTVFLTFVLVFFYVTLLVGLCCVVTYLLFRLLGMGCSFVCFVKNIRLVFFRFCKRMKDSGLFPYMLTRISKCIKGEAYDEFHEKTQQIRMYIRQTTIPGALFFTGNWGIGKTFLIKRFRNVPWYVMGRTKCYLSLYGVEKEQEIVKRIWYGIFFTSRLTCFLFSLLLALCVYAGFLNLRLIHVKDAMLFAGSCYSLILTMITLAWLFSRKFFLEKCLCQRYIVMDDFDRAYMPPDKVLAFINHFIEELGIPVIIIGNKDAIDGGITGGGEDSMPPNGTSPNTIHQNRYTENYKKTVEITVVLKNNTMDDIKISVQMVESVLRSSSLTKRFLSEHIEDVCKFILEPLREHTGLSTNYRALREAFLEFERCFNHSWARQFGIGYERDWYEVFMLFVAVRFYLGYADLPNKFRMSKTDLQNALKNPFQFDKPDRNIFPFWNIFPPDIINAYGRVLSEETWNEIIDHGYVPEQKLRDEINTYMLHDKSLGARWNRKCTNKEIEQLYKETEELFSNNGKVTLEEFLEITKGLLIVQDVLNLFMFQNVEQLFVNFLNNKNVIDYGSFSINGKVVRSFLEEKLVFFDHSLNFREPRIKELEKKITTLIRHNAFNSSYTTESSFEDLNRNIAGMSKAEWIQWWDLDRNYLVDFYSSALSKENQLFESLNSITDIQKLEERILSLFRHFTSVDESIIMAERHFWLGFADIMKKKMPSMERDIQDNWKNHIFSDFYNFIMGRFKDYLLERS